MDFNSRDLKGYNRCATRRGRNIRLKGDKGIDNVYEKAILIKDMIRKGLFHVATDEEIEATLEMNFRELGYPTEETARLHAADAYRQIMRYVHCEKREPEVAHTKTVHPFGLMDVRVTPDYIFSGIKDFPYDEVVGKKKTTNLIPKKYIEVVKIRCSKPDVTASGKYKDTGMFQNLELYCMLLYARSLVQPGETVNICASYYFLRKNNDNSATKEFDPDFFENKGAGNVVTLWEEYTPGKKTELDLHFEPQFKEFLDGEAITDDSTCKYCDFNELCHYTKPPKKLEEEWQKPTPVKSLHLTETQEKVVNFRSGVACVNAGAGAGKTMSIALRTAKMLSEGVRPEKICMLTFTNTGAEEMRSRIGQYTKELGCKANVKRLVSTTFNAFGYQVVKDNYEELGFDEAPGLIDDIERSAIIADILSKTVISGLDYRNFYAEMPSCRGALFIAKKAFEIIKKDRITSPAKLLDAMTKFRSFMDGTMTCQALVNAYQDYDAALKSRNLIEYADQELMVFQILEKHPDYFAKDGYEHIIVDEFQDTNEIQFELLKRLIDTPDFKSFMVVGDDSQSIFAFRGSTPKYIINFFDMLGMQGDVINMTENHRSTPQIIEFANDINARNENRVKKDLNAVKAAGSSVSVNVFWKRGEDTQFAVETIKKEHEAGMAYENIAYIAYTRSELIKMGTLLTEADIPWIMLNPEPMLENSRVQAALALVKFINDADATREALVYLNAKNKGGILDTMDDGKIAEALLNLDGQVETLSGIEDIEQQTAMFLGMLMDIDDDDEVYEQFIEMVKAKKDFDSMMEYCRLFEVYGDKQTCKREKSYPGVVLTTAHSSKGKEWPVVINNISKYHIKEIGVNIHSAEFEERRRLLFVSATRAKEKLYITGQAVAYGSKKDNDRVLNQFLIESCEASCTAFPTEPETKKKTKGKESGKTNAA